MAAKKKEAVTVTKPEQVTFAKEQILASGRYADRKDLLDALLHDGAAYTLESVDEMMENYMKGQVN